MNYPALPPGPGGGYQPPLQALRQQLIAQLQGGRPKRMGLSGQNGFGLPNDINPGGPMIPYSPPSGNQLPPFPTGTKQPSWTTPAISIDARLPGHTYTIPPQLTPYGRFHSQGQDYVNPDLNPGNVGAIAAGTPPLNVGQHPVIDRMHQVDAAHQLAKALAGMSQRTLRGARYRF